MPARYRVSIHWFRRDLRLTDNTALLQAAEMSEEVVTVYVRSEWRGAHAWTGPGRQAFLCACLESLGKNIEHIGGRLIHRAGDPVVELEKLIKLSKTEAVFFHRDPDPHGRTTETKVREMCRRLGIDCLDFKDCVLHEPGEVLTGAGLPYKVYTPYSRNWFAQGKVAPAGAVKRLAAPRQIDPGVAPSLSDWGLAGNGELPIEAGEKAARARLRRALEQVISRYGERRNDPAADATSHLGADLRYGTISVREVFHATEELRLAAPTEAIRNSIRDFQKQLAWREFFMAILGHFPQVLETDFNEAWRGLTWDEPDYEDRFARWQAGRTGFPIVDAGMRQLAATGTMHNRVRMIVAMFLTKDLHIHWRHGEGHFMRHLLDGEIANNNGGWQWSAGTGADAAPYFRIQNPWTQTERYDPEGLYIKRWVPELAEVPAKSLKAPPETGRPLGVDYVLPMLDHKTEREETLERFKRHRAKL